MQYKSRTLYYSNLFTRVASKLSYFLSHFNLFHWVRGHVALTVFAGAVHLSHGSPCEHPQHLTRCLLGILHSHREQTSQAIAGNELSGSSDTHFGERSYIKHIQPARANIVPEKLLTNAKSLLSSGQPHSIYLQPAGIVSPNCTFVCAAHRQRERRPVRLPTYSEPPFIYSSIQMVSSKSLAQCRLASKANQLAYSLLRARYQPTFGIGQKLCSIFSLLQITRFVLWSAQFEAAVSLAGLLAIHTCVH